MSEQIGIQATQEGPESLISAATSFLSPGTAKPMAGAAAEALSVSAEAPVRTVETVAAVSEAVRTVDPEETLRHAYNLVSPDLYVIDRLKKACLDPDYADIFGLQVNEKIAAFIYLAQRKLLALAGGASGEGNRELALYVEILFRLKAADGLMLIYDFAVAHEEDALSPAFWRNAASRCLYLLSLLPELLGRVLTFLAERPQARKRLEELAASANPDVAGSARTLLLASGNSSSKPAFNLALAPYISIFLRQYTAAGVEEPAAPAAPAAPAMPAAPMMPAAPAMAAAPPAPADIPGITEKVDAALKSENVEALAGLIVYGSPEEARETFRLAAVCPAADLYLDILEGVLDITGADPVRLTVVALELGRLNSISGVRGGKVRINHLLHRMASTVMADCVGVGQVAVRELAAANALVDIERVLQEAPYVPVAIEAINVLKDKRVLSTSLTYLEERPDLRPAYLAARAELLELRNLMEAAFSSSSEEVALNYLTRLQNMNAIPELRKLSQANTRISKLAQKVLAIMGIDF